MARISGETQCGSARPARSAREAGSSWRMGAGESWWTQHREASLNWLALGLLLAAWNASDNEAATDAPRRPESLRGYSYVSVRAAASAKLDSTRPVPAQSAPATGRLAEYLSKGHKSVNVL
jgi:hypothetical protein